MLLQQFFLACKLYESSLYIVTQFGHGQQFIWNFLVLRFMKINLTTIYLLQQFSLFLVLDTSEILDDIYIWVFLLKNEKDLSQLLLNILYGHCTRNCIVLVFFEGWSIMFCDKKLLFKIILYLCNSGIVLNWYFCSSGRTGGRKLPNPLLNRVFNTLSISVNHTLSFPWTNFGQKCL